MGDLLNIFEHQPHISGNARCLSCKHKWRASIPVGEVNELLCPECDLRKGVLLGMVIPESVWTCQCGNDIFALSGETYEMICILCGVTQIFPEE